MSTCLAKRYKQPQRNDLNLEEKNCANRPKEIEKCVCFFKYCEILSTKIDVNFNNDFVCVCVKNDRNLSTSNQKKNKEWTQRPARDDDATPKMQFGTHDIWNE